MKINNEKAKFGPPLDPFAPNFFFFFGGGGGSSPAIPLKMWDVMPPYLKTIFEQKTKQKMIFFDYFRLNATLNHFPLSVSIWHR